MDEPPMKQNTPATQGFTLVEILVAMTLGSFILGCICSIFVSQQRIHVMHQQIVNTQQSLRTCMYLMDQEIKQACLDPLGSAHPEILTAAAHTFAFQYDRNGNGRDFTLTDPSDPRAAQSGVDAHEKIAYRLSADADHNGLADRFPCKLYRCTWDSPDAMADQIEALNFVYRDEHNAVLEPLPLDETGRSLIRTVEVTLIARSARPDKKHLDARNYTNLQGDILIHAPNDPYHRRALSKVIRLRNPR